MKMCVNCRRRYYVGEGYRDMCSKDCYEKYWIPVEKLFAGETVSNE
ncbi:hypothetical protein [Bacillus paranthracis]|nr:hypothetical protein [Bacillus paranthracis]